MKEKKKNSSELHSLTSLRARLEAYPRLFPLLDGCAGSKLQKSSEAPWQPVSETVTCTKLAWGTDWGLLLICEVMDMTPDIGQSLLKEDFLHFPSWIQRSLQCSGSRAIKLGLHYEEMKEKVWEITEAVCERRKLPLTAEEPGALRDSLITLRGVCKKERLAFWWVSFLAQVARTEVKWPDREGQFQEGLKMDKAMECRDGVAGSPNTRETWGKFWRP